MEFIKSIKILFKIVRFWRKFALISKFERHWYLGLSWWMFVNLRRINVLAEWRLKRRWSCWTRRPKRTSSNTTQRWKNSSGSSTTSANSASLWTRKGENVRKTCSWSRGESVKVNFICKCTSTYRFHDSCWVHQKRNLFDVGKHIFYIIQAISLKAKQYFRTMQLTI